MRRHGALRLVLALLAMAFVAASIAPVTTALAADPSQEEVKATDRLVLRSGKIVEGEIVSETEAEVEMIVVVAGMSAKTTYSKSEILEIQRGVIEAPRATEEVPANTRRESRVEREEPAPREGGPVVYLMELDGIFIGDEGLQEFPQETPISRTPLQEILEDAGSRDPELIVVKLDARSVGGLAGVFVAETLGPIFEDEIYRNGQRIVFWIENAVGGAGLLPFVSPEIYFTSDGQMGGLASIGEIDTSDENVNEKLISAAIGHAEGMAIKGGYDPVLITAMARTPAWLFFKLDGGKPRYIQWEPRPSDGEGWILLTDDGAGKNKDESIFDGNDVLDLDEELARKLRVSKGTVDRVEDLVYELGVGRDYSIESGRSKRILSDWREDVANAIDQLRRLEDRMAEAGRARNDRRGLGQQMRYLRETRSLLERYAEVLDPTGTQRAQIDIQLEQLRLALRELSGRDRDRNRERSRNLRR